MTHLRSFLRPLTLSTTLVSAAALLAVGCSAGDGGGTGGSGSGSDSLDNGGTSTGTGTGTTTGGLNVGGDDTATPSDDRDLPVREEICTDSGCTCLRMALLGTLDSAANDKDTGPFIDWLNNNSDGTATIEMVEVEPTITSEWLGNYDILIIANVNGWTFDDFEKAAVSEWSHTTGGGIVSLTGFISKDAEEVATSQLIDFSGITYTSTLSAQGGDNAPVSYDGVEVKKYCLGDAIITTPINFTPLSGSMEKLTWELDYTGAYIGYGITAPEDATIVATDPMSSQPIAVAKEVDGAGRVFVWGDEWVVYANQWESTSENNQPVDPYNDCYKAAEGVEGEPGYEPAALHDVSTLYQTKQFWYNAINWVAPPNECGFTIEDEDVVVVK